jgi:hypothetical protein
VYSTAILCLAENMRPLNQQDIAVLTIHDNCVRCLCVRRSCARDSPRMSSVFVARMHGIHPVCPLCSSLVCTGFTPYVLCVRLSYARDSPRMSSVFVARMHGIHPVCPLCSSHVCTGFTPYVPGHALPWQWEGGSRTQGRLGSGARQISIEYVRMMQIYRSLFMCVFIYLYIGVNYLVQRCVYIRVASTDCSIY